MKKLSIVFTILVSTTLFGAGKRAAQVRADALCYASVPAALSIYVIYSSKLVYQTFKSYKVARHASAANRIAVVTARSGEIRPWAQKNLQGVRHIRAAPSQAVQALQEGHRLALCLPCCNDDTVRPVSRAGTYEQPDHQNHIQHRRATIISATHQTAALQVQDQTALNEVQRIQILTQQPSPLLTLSTAPASSPSSVPASTLGISVSTSSPTSLTSAPPATPTALVAVSCSLPGVMPSSTLLLVGSNVSRSQPSSMMGRNSVSSAAGGV